MNGDADTRELRGPERPAATAKSAEELQRLTVDEKLSEIERAVYLLSSGQEIQKISVVSHLPKLLHDSHNECVRRVIPKIRELLPVSHTEMQVEASDVFRRLLKDEDVPNSMYAQTFLPTILNSMESKDPDIGEMWLDTLLDVMELLSKDVIRKEVLPRAVSKAQMMQSVASRLVSCRMLSKIAVCIDTFVIKKELLPVVQALCQDVDYEVRACMCCQLHLIAKGLGLESTKAAILPELVELANDEEMRVRQAGLQAVVSILPLLDESTRCSVVVPLAVKMCQQALQTDDGTFLPSVSRCLGELLHNLSGSLSSSQKEWFFDFYRKLCCIGMPELLVTQQRSKVDINDNQLFTSKQPAVTNASCIEDDPVTECRLNAAFNFPAVLVLYSGVPLLEARLYETFSRLCRDPSTAVRQAVASGFHEVAKLLTAHLSHLAKDLVCLLRDRSLEVLGGLIPGLSITLETFGVGVSCPPTNGTDVKPLTMPTDFLAAILACDAVISSSNDWRLQEKFLLELSVLVKCCTSDSLYNRVVPLLFDKLLTTARALPVRRAAARLLLILLRNNKRLEQRCEMCRRIVQELCNGKSFRHRAAYIDVCALAVDLYSHSFFAEYFAAPLLSLATDAVPNVRMRVSSLLPRLKCSAMAAASRLTAATDGTLLQQIDTVVRQMMASERDRDALAAIKLAREMIDTIRCPGAVLSSEGVTGCKVYITDNQEIVAADREEQRRLKEEQLLLDVEEKEEEARKKAEKKSLRVAQSKFVLDPKDKIKKVITSKIPTAAQVHAASLASSRSESRKSTSSPSAPPQLPSTGTPSQAESRDSKRANTPHPSAGGHGTASPNAARRDQLPVGKGARSMQLPMTKRSLGSLGGGVAMTIASGNSSPVPAAASVTTAENGNRIIGNGKSDSALSTFVQSSRRPATNVSNGKALPVRVSKRD